MGIQLRTDHRVTIIGGTGDGKTTLALKFVAAMARGGSQRTVILNPGAEDVLYDKFGDASQVINPKWPEVQHVAPFVAKKKDAYGKIFWPILERGNVLTYIDEVFIMAETGDYSLGLQYLYQAGRRRNCGTVAVSQRPQSIPTFIVAMSDHLLVGDVGAYDVSFLNRQTNQRWETALQQRKQYEFLYWSRHTKLAPEIFRMGA